MAGLESSIRLLLQPSDEMKSFLECFLLQDDAQDASESKKNSGNSRHHDRVIAVITHKEEINGWEEGSVFVFKRKLFASNELEIQQVYPIYGDFTLSMAQLKQENLDLNSSPRSGFKITIYPGHALLGSEPLDLGTLDVSGLKNVIAECKRLKELSEIVPQASSPTQTYSWLASYATNTVYIPSLPSPFPDLRDLSKPLHDRLSSTSAGMPGDDIDDITLIRDDWARVRARNQCRKGRFRLKLRLGTFNVNGKMPSQDLATWVRGSSAGIRPVGEFLPSVKEFSPLSLGEVKKDPFDSQRAAEASTPTSSSFSYSSAASTDATYSPSAASTFTLDNTTNSVSSFTLSSTAPISAAEQTFVVESSPSHALSTPMIPVTLEPPDIPIVPTDSTESEDPDVLVLGFEELDLSTEALLYSTSTARENSWTVAIFAALGEKADIYEKLASKQLVGMLVIVIVKKSLKSCFSDIMSASVGAGIMGLMGNKGGTAIRLAFTPPAQSLDTLHSSSEHNIKNPGSTAITFVVSHLAAFDEMFEKRNANYHDLSKRLVFHSSVLASSPSSRITANDDQRTNISTTDGATEDSTPTITRSQTMPEIFGIFESDVLFWMGDLNYRIDLPDADIRMLLHSEHWKDKLKILSQYDQLKTAMRGQKAFDVFFEHEIRHLPTYRFSGGAASDELGYDIKRKPAWTDRILYSFSPLAAKVNQLSYSGHPELTMSDHRPASADFSVDVDLYDKDQLHTAVMTLFRQVQGMEEMQERGKAKLSHASINFGDIFYKRRKTTSFTFQNCGKVPLAFRFIPAEMHGKAFPDWLSVSHTTGLLLPNELIEITLTVFVDNTVASRLNLGSRDLNFTLIMHTLMGKDHFIPVAAKYHYTCFANRLSRLTKLPGPIRALTSLNDLLAEDRPINAPREIMRLVNWLMTCAHPAEELFIAEADPDIVNDIREHLDIGDEFPYSHDTRERSISIAFGGALMDLLNSLPESIVPKELHTRAAEAANRDEAFEILDSFSQETVNVWISVTALLHYLLHNSASASDAKAEKISAAFTPIFFGILRNDFYSPSSPNVVTPSGYQRFIMYFIQ